MSDSVILNVDVHDSASSPRYSSTPKGANGNAKGVSSFPSSHHKKRLSHTMSNGGPASPPTVATITEEFLHLQSSQESVDPEAGPSHQTSISEDSNVITTFSHQTSNGVLVGSPDALSLSRDPSTSNASQKLNLTLERSKTGIAEDSRKPKLPPVILCCASEEAEDYQVDLCPRTWFQCNRGFCDAIWRILFLLVCLPLCYPCYLTRKCRRRSKRVLDISSPEATPSRNPPTHHPPRTHPSSHEPTPRKMTVIKANKLDPAVP